MTLEIKSISFVVIKIYWIQLCIKRHFKSAKEFIFFLFFLVSWLLPSIKKTNFDKIYPKIGTQILSYKNFIKN